MEPISTASIRPAGLSPRPGVAEDRQAAEAAYDANLATWHTGEKALAEQRKTLTADPETVSFAELRARRDAVREGELTQAQAAVGLCREYVALAEARVDGLKAAAAKSDSDLAKAEATVARKLNSAGVSVESQPGFQHNRAAAEVTFRQCVHQSADYKAAKLAATEAAEAAAANLADIRSGKERLAQAVAYLQSVAERVAGVGSSTVRNFATVAA